MPSWDQILEQGVWKRELPTAIAFEKNVADPVGNPWKTPSGKIEIYSEALEKIASERELSEGQVISPIPSLFANDGKNSAHGGEIGFNKRTVKSSMASATSLASPSGWRSSSAWKS